MSVTTRAARTVLITGLAVIAVALVSGADARAGGDADAEQLLERARTAPADTFAGYVEVRWEDESGADKIARIGARSLRGAFVVGTGDDQVQGDGLRRWSGVGGGPEVAWRTVDGLAAPKPGSSWDLELAGDDTVAGRAATVVEASRDGDVRARYAIDDETGQLLRREILDADGEVVRSVGFVRLTTGIAAPAVPSPPEVAAAGPVAIDEVPDGFLAPDHLAGGYRLLGRYQHPDGSVQLFYGDGLFAVSVFQQRGLTDWSGLPAGGRGGRTDGMRTHLYTTASGDVIVWGDDDDRLVITAVADGPPGAARAVIDDLADQDDDRSTLQEIADLVLEPFGWD